MEDMVKEELIAKYLSGECNSEEKMKVDELLSNEADLDDFEVAKQIFHVNKPIQKFDSNLAWNSVKNKISIEEEKVVEEKTFDYSLIYKIAASIIFVIGITYTSLFVFTNTDSNLIQLESFNTPIVSQKITEKSEINSFTLIDGSRVTLNSGSKLNVLFDKDYSQRLVELTGEAYFEVESDIEKPFIIKSANTYIKVVGTKFNVTAWDEKEIIVAVEEGKVQFNSFGIENEFAVILEKDNVSKIVNSKKPTIPISIDVEKFHLYWLKNELYFYNAPFDDVIRRLELKYDIEIRVKNISILSKHLTARFKDESLDGILNTIAAALELNIEKDNSERIIFDEKN